MPDTLPVHVNQASLHSLDVPTSFETDGSFDVQLINHGQPVHVHLHLGDTLSDVASIEAPNHHVERDSQRTVRVTVHRPVEMFGKLKVASGYGAETRYIDINLDEPADEADGVQVDESLSKPTSKPKKRSANAPGDGSIVGSISIGDLSVPILVLAAVAVVLATGVATVLGGTLAWAVALFVFAVVLASVTLLLVD